MPVDMFGDPIEDDDDNTTSRGDNPSFQELRKHARQLEKQLKEYQKEVDELRSFRAAAEAQERLAKAQALGLKEGQAKYFLKAHDGEVTPEAVQQFLREIGAAPPAEETTPVAETDATTPEFTIPSFSPVSLGGTPPAKARLTYEQYQKLLREDPQAAFKAVAERRVDDLYENPA
jgi:TolA-binding protein